MKKLIFIFIFLPGISTLFAQESYVMVETMYIQPKADKIAEFNEALKAHNKKFHAEGVSAVSIDYIVNGPHEGEYGWIMGPATFTDLDGRSSGKSHDDDWNEVMKYTKKTSETEYWRKSDKVGYTPETGGPRPKSMIRFFDVKDGHGKEFEELLMKIDKVINEKKYPYSFNVYWNQFETGNDRDVAVVYSFSKYAIFDMDLKFRKDFDEVHGDGTWENTFRRLQENADLVLEELREEVPELGGR